MSLNVPKTRKNICGQCKTEKEIIEVRGTIVCNWKQTYFMCKSCIIRVLKEAAEQTYFKQIVQKNAPGTDIYSLKKFDEVKEFIEKLDGTVKRKRKFEDTQNTQNTTTESQYTEMNRRSQLGGGMPKPKPNRPKKPRTFHQDTPTEEDEVEEEQQINQNISTAAPRQTPRLRERGNTDDPIDRTGGG